MELNIKLRHERSTKNTEKYIEIVEPGQNPVLVTQYVQKSAFKDGKCPDELLVTIRAD